MHKILVLITYLGHFLPKVCIRNKLFPANFSVVRRLASGARGPRFVPRSRRGKFWCPNMLSLVSFAGMTLDKACCPSDQDVNWMSPVQGKSSSVQVKEPYGNLDMVTCRLSSCNPECTKYIC